MHTHSSTSTRIGRFVSTRWRLLAATTTMFALAACGSDDVGAAKLKAIPEGAARTEILSTMGNGPMVAPDASDEPRVVNGYRRQMYIADGGKAVEIVWYRETPGAMDDAFVPATETPVVIEGDTLAGWGWGFFHDYAERVKIPDPTKDAARLDSVSKSQQQPPKAN